MATATGSLQSGTGETAETRMLQPSPAMRAYLVLAGSAAGTGLPRGGRLQSIQDGLEIGRGRPKPGRGVRMLAMDDPCVSSAHARVLGTPAGFEVIDLDSRNGTFVDGVPVKRRQLRDGAVLVVGGCAAVFRLL